jgi:hypothetical protein
MARTTGRVPYFSAISWLSPHGPNRLGGEFSSRFWFPSAERPREGSADVVLFRGQAAGPGRPGSVGQGRFRRPGQVQRPIQQAPVKGGLLAGEGQPAGGELADGHQQRIPDRVAVIDLHDGLAGQTG